MAAAGFTPIQIYYSTTGSAVPLAADLLPGELGLNIADMKLYCENSSGVVTLLASAASALGDVAGPASATDNAVVRFDGTTGKLVQNSAVTIADTTGDITGGAYNKVTITAPASSATLTIANGKTLTANNTITLAGTDATTMTFPSTSATIARTDAGQTFTGTQTVLAAATQDAVAIAGRAGGTSSYVATVTPATLSASRTITLPDASTTMVGTDATQTLTNKRIDPRVSSTASISSPLAWNSDSFDMYAATAQAGALTINADSGTPVNGQKMIFRFKDNGTARGLTWTTGSSKSFQAVGITLPTTTVINKTTYVGCIYNAADDRWDAVATVTQA